MTLPNGIAMISIGNQRELTDRVKAAIKTALAMVLAYGIALSMDWNHADWAAFSVAFCTLSSFGESLNKGLLRLSGTFVGVLATITLIALFPQDRWLFLIGMSVFTGLCTYMMAGTSRWYFWQLAGLSVPLLALAGGSNPLNDFQTVVTRFEETALGVVSYSLVWLLIWPTSSRGALENAVRRLVAAQRNSQRTISRRQSVRPTSRTQKPSGNRRRKCWLILVVCSTARRSTATKYGKPAARGEA